MKFPWMVGVSVGPDFKEKCKDANQCVKKANSSLMGFVVDVL